MAIYGSPIGRIQEPDRQHRLTASNIEPSDFVLMQSEGISTGISQTPQPFGI